MKPTPTVTKPSTIWLRCGHLWHYVSNTDDGRSFCGNCASTQSVNDTRKTLPKKTECCSICHAEAMRIQELWAAYRRGDCSQSLLHMLERLHRLAITTRQKPSGVSSDAENFVVAIKALASLGHCCNAILERKYAGQIKAVRGQLNVSPVVIKQWDRTCTTTFETYPEIASFWRPILTQFSRPGEVCTYSDLVDHVTAVSDANDKYLAECLLEAKNDKIVKSSQKTGAKKIKKPIPRQHTESAKLEFVAPQRSLKQVRQKQLEMLYANSRWNTYERQGTRSRSSDPAKNSESGIPGNPTYRRW